MTSTNAMTKGSRCIVTPVPQCYPDGISGTGAEKNQMILLRKVVARDRIELSTLRFSDFPVAG
jgi:hypothetical protein